MVAQRAHVLQAGFGLAICIGAVMCSVVGATTIATGAHPTPMLNCHWHHFTLMQMSSHNLDKPWFCWGASRWRQRASATSAQLPFIPTQVGDCWLHGNLHQHPAPAHNLLVCFYGKSGPSCSFGVKGVCTNQLLCLAVPFKVVQTVAAVGTAGLGAATLAAHTVVKNIVDYANNIFGTFSTVAQSLVASELGKVMDTACHFTHSPTLYTYQLNCGVGL